jgi:hypothetical protein
MKSVLILENSSDQLAKRVGVDKNTPYLLEGVFTHLGIKNRNQRIYTAEKFLPHINELMERKRDLHVIYGELDHPESFEISLERASHVIESLNYDRAKNVVTGEIRILSKDRGQTIRSLIDDGLPIFVSSRAAGITESDGTVSVKKLVTYDAVGDPGFFGTDMRKKGIMNESLGFDTSSDSNLLILDISESAAFDEVVKRSGEMKAKDVSKEMQAFVQSELDVMRKFVLENIKTTDSSEVKAILEKYEEMAEQKDRMEKYSKLIYKRLQVTNEALVNLENKTSAIVKHYDEISRDVESTIAAQSKIEEKFSALVDSADEIATVVNESIESDDKVVKGVQKYTNHLYEALKETTETTNNLVEYQDVLRNTTINAITEVNEKAFAKIGVLESYITKMEAKINELINATNGAFEKIDGLEETVSENISTTESLTRWTDYIAENTIIGKKSNAKISKGMNHMVEFIDTHMTPKINAVLEYQNILGKKLNENLALSANLTEDMVVMKEHANYITKISESLITQSDKTALVTNYLINHVDYVIEGFNSTRSSITESVKTELGLFKTFEEFSGLEGFEGEEFDELDGAMESDDFEDFEDSPETVNTPNGEFEPWDETEPEADEIEDFEIEEDEEDFDDEFESLDDSEIKEDALIDDINMEDTENMEVLDESDDDLSDEELAGLDESDDIDAEFTEDGLDEEFPEGEFPEVPEGEITEEVDGEELPEEEFSEEEIMGDGEIIEDETTLPEFECGTYAKVLSNGKIGLIQAMESANVWSVEIDGVCKPYSAQDLQPLKKRQVNMVEKVQEAIQEFKKRELASKVEDPHFFLFLQDTDIASYNSLDQDDKESVLVKLDESKGLYTSRQDVLHLIQSALSKNVETFESALLRCMPSDIKPIWESLDYSARTAVLSAAKIFPLQNDSARTNFWLSRNFALNESNKTSKKLITESMANPENDALSPEYIQLFRDALSKGR